MNKKRVIKQYEEIAKNNLNIKNNEMSEAIIKKAKLYNISLFEDKILASRLLGIESVQELPKERLSQIAKIIKSIIDIEEKAQLSS
ncbi:MAG: hypothetical protein GXP61_04585 [Epsilonproteobacteria bacterium]|nr:hypothetical protein [Campylobacterota bacterium]